MLISKQDIPWYSLKFFLLILGSWIKKGAVVIDCGINAIPDATKKSGQRLVGNILHMHSFMYVCE